MAKILSRGFAFVVLILSSFYAGVSVFFREAEATDYLFSTGVEHSLTATVNSGDAMNIYLERGHSYNCEASPQSVSSNIILSTNVRDSLNLTGESFTARRTSQMSPVLSFSVGFANGSRLSLIPPTSKLWNISFTTTFVGGESVVMICRDTTLEGGFNTFINNFNFLELTNLTTDAISGTITAVNFNGAVVINAQPFSVGAGLRFDVDIHTPAGPNRYGTVTVVHDGPTAGLSGTISQYAGTVSSFELRATIPLKTLGQQ